MPVIAIDLKPIEELIRLCTGCGRQLVVPPSFSQDTVQCGKCGTDVLPPGNQNLPLNNYR